MAKVLDLQPHINRVSVATLKPFDKFAWRENKPSSGVNGTQVLLDRSNDCFGEGAVSRADLTSNPLLHTSLTYPIIDHLFVFVLGGPGTDNTSACDGARSCDCPGVHTRSRRRR